MSVKEIVVCDHCDTEIGEHEKAWRGKELGGSITFNPAGVEITITVSPDIDVHRTCVLGSFYDLLENDSA